MSAMNVIVLTQTEGASPAVFIPKKDETVSFCINYREISAVTLPDLCPCPRMDECIDFLGEPQKLSTPDASSGYWRIEVDPSEREKAAFTSQKRL